MVGRARCAVRPGSPGLGAKDHHARHEREAADPSLARWPPRRPIPPRHLAGWQTAGRPEHARACSAGREPRPVGSRLPTRHARACRGHPRLSFMIAASKTWMAGTSPAMTAESASTPMSARLSYTSCPLLEIRPERRWYLQGGLVGKKRLRILGADHLPQRAFRRARQLHNAFDRHLAHGRLVLPEALDAAPGHGEGARLIEVYVCLQHRAVLDKVKELVLLQFFGV